MVFSKKDYNYKDTEHVIVTCHCGAENIQFSRFDNEVSMNISSGSDFYQEQVGIFAIIGRRVYRAWQCFRGKDYRRLDIVLTKEDVLRLADALGVMAESMKYVDEEEGKDVCNGVNREVTGDIKK